MGLIEKAKDKLQRHAERHTALTYQCLFSDSVAFVNHDDWDSIALENTVFLRREYLATIETHSPENSSQRYAMAYSDGVPVVIVACQVAEISGERLIQQDDGVKGSIARNYQERVLVCGNLVSSGLHGVAFAEGLDPETGWRIVAELLYKIRRAEKLVGKIDFVMIKDIKAYSLESSQVVERFSYRKIQTDPDMVLDLEESIATFDDYLMNLNSKYRSRVRKIIKTLDKENFICEKICIDEAIDQKLHCLYLAVEEKSATRLATLPVGYFLGLQESLKDNFTCYVIKRDSVIVGFISVIKDRKDAVAYYVGLDYETNTAYPIYFRLLQLVIQSAIDMRCERVLFGRTALEPKANLGAKPVDTFVWARHRIPAINFIVRKLFRNVPFDTAPERTALKQ